MYVAKHLAPGGRRWRFTAIAAVLAAAAAIVAGSLALAGPAGATTGCQSVWPGTAYPPQGCGDEVGMVPQTAAPFAFDVYQQHATAFNKIINWPHSTSDPAEDFFAYDNSGQVEYEYAPGGHASGLCVTVTGSNYGLVLRPCGWWTWQRFWILGQPSGPNLLANVQVRGDVVDGSFSKGAQYVLTRSANGRSALQEFNYTVAG